MEAQMKLEHEIDFHWLILFALPTIFSSIFANLYTTVDGIFVAQWGQHGRPFRHQHHPAHDVSFLRAGHHVRHWRQRAGGQEDRRGTDAGSDGVASLTIIWYAQGLFGGLFRGYINGIASVVSYNLGRGDKARLSRLFRISVWTLGVTAAVVTAASYLFGGAVVGVFAKGNAHVAAISLRGFHIAAASFLMMAYNIFASGWFTALNDGKTSAILSFCRTMVFMVIPVLVLPRFFEMDGVWMALAAGEILSIAMSIYYFIKYRAMWQTPKAAAAS